MLYRMWACVMDKLSLKFILSWQKCPKSTLGNMRLGIIKCCNFSTDFQLPLIWFDLSVSIWSNGKSRSYEPLASFGLLKLTVSLRAPWAVALVDRQLRIYFVNIGLAGSRTSKLHRVGNKMNECFLIHSCRYFDFQTKFYSLHEGKYLLSIPRVFPQATNPCLDCMMCFKNVNSNAQWHKSFSEEGCRTGGAWEERMLVIRRRDFSRKHLHTHAAKGLRSPIVGVRNDVCTLRIVFTCTNADTGTHYEFAHTLNLFCKRKNLVISSCWLVNSFLASII